MATIDARALGRWLCRAGRHPWEPQHHSIDGQDIVYLRCPRCAKESTVRAPSWTGRTTPFGKV